jgi:hypothetical protein
VEIFHNEELHNFYSSQNSRPTIRMAKSRSMIWTAHVAHMREMRNAHKILIKKPKGKIQIGRPTRLWENNIKMGLRE